MAISNGRFGELSGKICNLVSYDLKSKNIVRRMGKNSKYLELNLATYVLSGARRSSGKDNIALPANYIDKELHIYIAFKSSDGQSISDRVHLLPLN